MTTKTFFNDLANIISRYGCSIEAPDQGDCALVFQDPGEDLRVLPSEPSIIAIRQFLQNMKNLCPLRDVLGDDKYADCMSAIIEDAVRLQETLEDELDTKPASGDGEQATKFYYVQMPTDIVRRIDVLGDGDLNVYINENRLQRIENGDK